MMHRFVLSALLLTLTSRVGAQPFGDSKVSQSIDTGLLAVLSKEKLKPVGACSDAEFVRRIYLDLLGRIPTAAETTEYLQDKTADKHHRLIDRLLTHWEMPAYWREVLHVWMNGRSPDPGLGYPDFRVYLEQSLAANKPWDKLARELLAPGLDDATRPAAFFLGSRLRTSDREERLDGMTVAVASTFFGVRLECAKCHDHPYVDEWKQEHYYGLASFLNRTELAIIDARPTLRERDNGDVTFQNRKREMFSARLMFLDSKVIAEPKSEKKTGNGDPKELPATAAFSRRKALADYAFVPANPYFKRAVVNRVWKQLMGVGLVEPVDQIHDANPATHPGILDLLSEDFASHGFDLRRLLALILHTDAYRRSSAWPGNDRPKDSLYAVAMLRPLAPEQLTLSVATATSYAEIVKLKSKKSDPRDVRGEIEKDYKLVIASFESGADSFAATTSQSLFMTFNSGTQKYLQPAAGNLVARLIKTTDFGEVAQQCCLAVLSRPATDLEKETITTYLSTAGVPREQLCREVVWALLNSAEFRFNH